MDTSKIKATNLDELIETIRKTGEITEDDQKELNRIASEQRLAQDEIDSIHLLTQMIAQGQIKAI